MAIAGQEYPALLFTDVTAAAGLMNAKNVSGHPANKQFLLEEMGCGAAFFDYDNDGWLDIFLVNADRLEPGAGAAAHQLPVPQQR